MSNNMDLLTMNEVAQRLRIDPTTIRRWAHCGILDVVQLPTVGKNTRYRMRRSALETLLSSTSKKD